MVEIVRQWLKSQLDKLVNVQMSVVGAENTLVVHFWSGVRANIYFADEPIKTRTIKHILQESSGVGVGSLFMISANLLPPHRARIIPEEWLMAIHTMTNDRIYAYQLIGREPVLFQAHFEPVNGLSTWDVMVGPAFSPLKLRFYRASLKSKVIKGDWLVVDFDTIRFWRKDEYRHAHSRQTQERSKMNGGTTWYSYSAFQSWADDVYSETNRPSALKTFLDTCYERLGLQPDASQEAVKMAFRKLAREVHPDVSDLPTEEAHARFQAISEAYEYIKSANGWA